MQDVFAFCVLQLTTALLPITNLVVTLAIAFCVAVKGRTVAADK